MSSAEWKVLYSTIPAVDKATPRAGRRTVYSEVLIVAMYFWTVWHDRPLCWAAQREHYGSVFRPRRLPSRSQFCRRLRGARCASLVAAVQQRLAQSDVPTAFRFLDGRAFPVGPDSTDADARPGRCSGGFARGYKLHALVTEDGRFPHIRVTPLNAGESGVARERVAAATLGGVVLADGNYDDSRLYDAVTARGALRWAGGAPPCYGRRRAVERYFGQLSAFGGGLAPLPAWGRTLPRVRLWITAKVAIYHVRLLTRSAAAG